MDQSSRGQLLPRTPANSQELDIFGMERREKVMFQIKRLTTYLWLFLAIFLLNRYMAAILKIHRKMQSTYKQIQKSARYQYYL